MKKNTCKENGDSLTQKSETVDFEQELYKAFGQIKDFTLGMRIAKRFYNMGRKHNEPVSEDLMEATNNYCVNVRKGYPRVMDETDRYICNAFKAGAQWQKEQIMKDATEVTVHIEAGNYPYIPQMELYDYDKDIPLAKEGDRYKVVLIKEAEL